MMKKQPTTLRVREAALLGDFLEQKMGGMTRTSIKNMLTRRIVHVNGGIETRMDLQVNPGDEVTIQPSRGNQTLVHPKLRIVYEDDYLIVVEKKCGLLTVAAHPGATETTVFSILLDYVRRESKKNGIYVVHRLDRETSGLLVFAKRQDLQEYMRTYWRQIVTNRTYIAVAEGLIEKDEDTVRSWLTEDPKSTIVKSSPVDNGGKLAITHYKVIKRSSLNALQEPLAPVGAQPSEASRSLSGSEKERGRGKGLYSLVELHLETGRTNQIRVHLASMGHPVLSDRKYGHHEAPIDRLALHARILEFIHPVTEEKVHFETPVPRDFLHVFH